MGEAVREFGRDLREILAHASVPFDVLAEQLSPRRQRDRHPVFQSMFVYQEASPPLSLGGTPLEPVTLDLGGSKFDLTLFVTESEGALEIAVEYRADRFDEVWMRQLLDHYEALLEHLPEGLERPRVRGGDAGGRGGEPAPGRRPGRGAAGPRDRPLAPADPGSGPPAAGRARRDLRRGPPELRRAGRRGGLHRRRALGPGSGPGRPRRAVPRALGRDDRRSARVPPGGGRLRAAGPGLPDGEEPRCARGRGRGRGAHDLRPAGPPAGGSVAGDRGRVPRRRRSRPRLPLPTSRRTPRPTSSTPRARPGVPRASSSPTATSGRPPRPACRRTTPRRAASSWSPAWPSTARWRACSGPWPRGAPSWFPPTTRSGTPAGSRSWCGRSG